MKWGLNFTKINEKNSLNLFIVIREWVLLLTKFKQKCMCVYVFCIVDTDSQIPPRRPNEQSPNWRSYLA